jgi:lysophospholipase L1-like esterase
MSNPSYCCNYCDYKAINKHYIKHIVKNHKNDIFTTKNEKQIKINIRAKLLFETRIKSSGGQPLIYICFGCNLFWERKTLADQHLKECKNKDKHIEFLKSLLPENDTEIKPDSTESPTNSIVSIEKNDELLEQIEFYKQQIQKHKDKIIKLNQIIDEKSEESQEIIEKSKISESIAEYLIQNNNKYYLELKEKLKEDYPDRLFDDYF